MANRIYQNGINVDRTFNVLIVCSVWILFCLIIAKILYKRGLVHYEGYGG